MGYWKSQIILSASYPSMITKVQVSVYTRYLVKETDLISIEEKIYVHGAITSITTFNSTGKIKDDQPIRVKCKIVLNEKCQGIVDLKNACTSNVKFYFIFFYVNICKPFANEECWRHFSSIESYWHSLFEYSLQIYFKAFRNLSLVFFSLLQFPLLHYFLFSLRTLLQFLSLFPVFPLH